MYHPHPDDHELSGGLTIPGSIFKRLFAYQKTCVKWLWELFSQETGGVLGDEMGLGKTVQLISFVASLAYSRKLKGPVLVVVPATVLRNWLAALLI
jgi:DNA excision repair protein ERCC-6